MSAATQALTQKVRTLRQQIKVLEEEEKDALKVLSISRIPFTNVAKDKNEQNRIREEQDFKTLIGLLKKDDSSATSSRSPFQAENLNTESKDDPLPKESVALMDNSVVILTRK